MKNLFPTLVILLLISACSLISKNQDIPAITISSTPSPKTEKSPTFTHTPSPTLTPSVTPTITPTNTATQTLTPTNVPEPIAAISTSNATRISELVRFGLGKVNQLVYSKDGNRLALASSQGINLHDGETLSFDRQIITGAAIKAATFTPDNQILISLNDNGEIQQWEVDSGHELHSLATGLTRQKAFISTSGDKLALAFGRTVRVLDVKSGRQLRTLGDHTCEVKSVAFSPDENYVATASCDGTVKIWETNKWTIKRSISSTDILGGIIWSLAFNQNGTSLVAGSSDGNIYLLNMDRFNVSKILHGHTGLVLSLAFSPTDEVLASSGKDGSVRLWNLKTGQVLNTLVDLSAPVTYLTFRPDGQVLVAKSDDGIIRLWDANSGKQLSIQTGYMDEVHSVDFSPDGHTIAHGGKDGAVRLRDVRTGDELGIYEGHVNLVRCIAFNPSGELLASGDRDTVRIWDVNSGRKLTSFSGHQPIFPEYGNVLDVAFNPDGSILASAGGDGIVILWNLSNRTKLHELEAAANSVTFSPDGKFLYTGGSSGVYLWRVSNGKQLREVYRRQASVGPISPDGRFVVVQPWAPGWVPGTISIIEVSNWKQLFTLASDSGIYSMDLSPDGTILAAAGFDGTIRLWDIGSGSILQDLIGHKGSIYDIAFSTDGKYLVTAGVDGSVRLWGVLPEDTISLDP